MSGLLPSAPFRKADLRSLLSQMVSESGVAGRSLASSAALQAAKQWAMMANLIDDRGLTAEGRLVATKDPYLEATVTDWVIHFYLSYSDQKLFQYFIYNFLLDYPNFSQDKLLDESIKSFPSESPTSLNESIRTILDLYTNSQATAKNKFLARSSQKYSIGHPDLTNPYTTGYLLAKCWEHKFGPQTSVLVDQILDVSIGFISVLGISAEEIRHQLDILAENEIIAQRSARPHLAGTQARIKQDTETSYQVVRCWDDPIELLQQAYENDRATPNQPLIRSLDVILDDDDDIPDFSQLLEWIAHLHPRQICWLLNVGAIVA